MLAALECEVAGLPDWVLAPEEQGGDDRVEVTGFGSSALRVHGGSAALS